MLRAMRSASRAPTWRFERARTIAEVKLEGMRPGIEDKTSPDIVNLFQACWHEFVGKMYLLMAAVSLCLPKFLQ